MLRGGLGGERRQEAESPELSASCRRLIYTVMSNAVGSVLLQPDIVAEKAAVWEVSVSPNLSSLYEETAKSQLEPNLSVFKRNGMPILG